MNRHTAAAVLVLLASLFGLAPLGDVMKYHDSTRHRSSTIVNGSGRILYCRL